MKSLFLALAFTTVSAGAEADPHDVYGLWMSEARDGHIEIRDCGDGTPCGALVWVDLDRAPTDRDEHNPDANLRTRSLIGVPIVWGYARSKKEWRGGHIYNPEDGKTFRSSLKRLGDGMLSVKGCLGPLCRTNIWTPISATVQRGEEDA